MSPHKLLLGFFARLAILYAVLMAAGPILRPPYAAFQRGLGNMLFSYLGRDGSADFRPGPPGEDIKDILVVIVNTSVPGTRIEIPMPLASRYSGFIPTAVVISLVLATPLAWRRRLTALAIGLALVNVFIAAYMGISILDEISNSFTQIPAHGFLLPVWLKSVVRFLVINVVESLNACAYIVPVFIWIASAFRRRDRETILARIVPPTAQSEPPVGG